MTKEELSRLSVEEIRQYLKAEGECSCDECVNWYKEGTTNAQNN